MQDFTLTENNARIDIHVIADGVSSCKNSHIGAELACRAVCSILSEDCDYFFACKEKYAGVLLLNYVRRMLRERAEKDGEELTSYASTLSFVCRHKKSGDVMIFSLGDSKVFCLETDDLQPLTSAKTDGQNRCVTTLTQGAEECIQIRILKNKTRSDFLLMTDGAWQMMYVNCFLRSDLRVMLQNRDFGSFATALEQMQPADDCSFIAAISTEDLSDDR